MNKTSPFVINGEFYYVGTIVKIKKEYHNNVGFHMILKFVGYITEERAYCFSSLQNNFEIYKIPVDDISKYIENILSSGEIEENDKRVDQKYIEGIVSAWIWYILAMFVAIFAKDPVNIIASWVLSTFIFFRWRHKKIKGG